MLETILSQIAFYATLIFVTYLPGHLLLLAIFGKNKIMNALERFIASFGLSIISIDLVFFIFSRAHIGITRYSSILGISLLILVLFFIYRKRGDQYAGYSQAQAESEKLFTFSKNQIIIISLLLFLTVFIKISYLSGTVYPTATDMGHHMYWSNWMVENNALPTYDGMPDFIIGEHVVFGTIALISGADFFSAFPVILLLMINLAGIMAVFLLALRIFKKKNVAILTLLFLGVLYAISSPQAKFVSGGVIGNIMGNFFMPLSFYFYYRAFSFFEENNAPQKESRIFLALAVFSTFGLFYTHHLTSFIFLFITALFLLIFFALNLYRLKEILSDIFRVVFSPQVITVFLLGLVFFFFIFTPTYVKGSAVGTAVGAPSKDTRAGLSIDNILSSIGEARVAFGFVGLLILAWAIKRKNFGYMIIISWAVMIFVMSTMPNILFVNLPSNRIGNYLSYPLAIISAYAVYSMFALSKNKKVNSLMLTGFILLLAFVFVDGLHDSAQAFKKNEDLSPIAQTFNASSYLAENTAQNDTILKDHNYITADSWIKLFVMRGYKNPLSRGYFKRYDDITKPREMCTLTMIASPDGQDAQACFQETGTDFIMVNPAYDSAQFKKAAGFNQVYAASKINIYYRK